MAKHRPELRSLPTTNGDHCTGDGIKMALAVGAGTVDMASVQVHPTGLVHPGEPDAKVKFLAAEALRGVGGILLDANGERFCDELGRRDYVSGEMDRGKGPFRLVLNGKASKEIEWHCKHYVGRGIMKRFGSGAEVAAELGVSSAKLAETFGKYNAAARSNDCPFGKKFFNNLPLEMQDTTWHVAIVCTEVHYTMGGLWVDYHLMSNVKGLFVLGEANFSDHGANRLGASALMQGLADGYFVIPYTMGGYLAGNKFEPVDEKHPACQAVLNEVKERTNRLISNKGGRSADSFHRELGHMMLDKVGMSRDRDGLTETVSKIRNLRDAFWDDVRVPGDANNVNQELEKAGRVADFLEFAELMAIDALNREESCGGHFREEHQTPEGEAKRDDDNFAYSSCCEFTGVGNAPVEHKEPFSFEYVKLTQRSYK